jgi:hypothetical protein
MSLPPSGAFDWSMPPEAGATRVNGQPDVEITDDDIKID